MRKKLAAVILLSTGLLIVFLFFFQNAPQKQIEKTLRQLASNINAISHSQGATRLAYLSSLKNFSAPQLKGNWKNQRRAILNASEIPGITASYLKQYSIFNVNILEIKISISSKEQAETKLIVKFLHNKSRNNMNINIQQEKNYVTCTLVKDNGRWLIEKFSCLSINN